jgi:hypothetical protein
MRRPFPAPKWKLVRCSVVVPIALSLSACTALLPAGREEMLLPWASYDEAIKAIDRIEPHVMTRSVLAAERIDPSINPSITVLSFNEVLAQFPALSAVPPDKLEAGIYECLSAGKRCTGYSINVRETRTKRVGNFWLDILNFRRDTLTTGWSLHALIIFVDDVVVYALAGGQPRIEARQSSRNPLGPLQSLGESIRP